MQAHGSALERLFQHRRSSPVEEQERIRFWLKDAVSAGPLGWREPNGPVSDIGTTVVVGLAPAWNGYDRELLLLLERAAAEPRAEHIEVFDVDAALTVQDLAALVPGESTYLSLPFLAVWTDGQPWFQDCGGSAAAWLWDRYRSLQPPP